MKEVTLKGTYKDFIGVYENMVPDDFCDEIIEQFDYHQTVNSMVYCEDEQFSNSNAGRFDWAIDLSHMTPRMNRMADRDLNQYLIEGIDEYTHIFGHMKEVPMYTTTQKVQKTPAGGGYHVWHDENSGLAHSDRKSVV